MWLGQEPCNEGQQAKKIMMSDKVKIAFFSILLFRVQQYSLNCRIVYHFVYEDMKWGENNNNN